MNNVNPMMMDMAPHNTNESGEMRRELGLLDSTMINVGTIIGSGIFVVPTTIALYLTSSIETVGVWFVAGIISLFGALAIAELGASMPQAGGQYVYLTRAYGPVWGYLYGWTTFSVINTASIAAVAIAFATYLAYFFPMEDMAIKAVAIVSILFLTAINSLGVRTGATVQNTVTFMKVGAMFALIFMSFFLSGGNWGNFEPVLPTLQSSRFLNPEGWGPLGLALIAVLWAYDGWIQITYVAGEIKEPQKNLPRAVVLSTLIVIGLYTLINLAYVYVLSVNGVAHSKLVASDTAQAAIGPAGAAFVSLAVVISTFGANNSFILTGARVYYAMAKEGLFFKSVAKLHEGSQTPRASLLLQGLWSCMLVLSGSYDQLFTYVVFAAWIFYAMTCLAVFVLRRKEPHLHRPYKTWGYPVTPILFTIFALWLVTNTIMEAPRDAAIGAGIILMGLPGYFYWNKKKQSEVPCQ